MLKALFFDMDETLCDTGRANDRATRLMGQAIRSGYGDDLDGQAIAEAYVAGIYRQWRGAQHERYLPIIEQQGESAFRVQLIQDLLEVFKAEVVDIKLL